MPTMCKGILERERECTQMAHNCRVITKIVKTAISGWLVGSLCVTCGFFGCVGSAQIEFRASHLSRKLFIQIYQVR